MPTRIEAASTTGLVKTTDLANTNPSFAAPSNSGKIIQLNSDGNIPPTLLNPVADQLRLTTDTSITTSEADITSWTRINSTAQGTTSSQVSESSGIFTFPTAGLYLVMFHASIGRVNANVSAIDIRLRSSTDNFESNTLIIESNAGITGTSPSELAPLITFINVSNTATDKIKVTAQANVDGSQLRGSGGTNKTYITFLRITGT